MSHLSQHPTTRSAVTARLPHPLCVGCLCICAELKSQQLPVGRGLLYILNFHDPSGSHIPTSDCGTGQVTISSHAGFVSDVAELRYMCCFRSAGCAALHDITQTSCVDSPQWTVRFKKRYVLPYTHTTKHQHSAWMHRRTK